MAKIQLRAYLFETTTHPQSKQVKGAGPADVILERMGELPNATKDLKIARFQEYIPFAIRGFWSLAAISGDGFYGPDLETAIRTHTNSHREIIGRKEKRSPFPNRISKACRKMDWVMDYGSVPEAITSMLSDHPATTTTKAICEIGGS